MQIRNKVALLNFTLYLQQNCNSEFNTTNEMGDMVIRFMCNTLLAYSGYNGIVTVARC